jgi:GNAT superfamily N-acetyltransferase
VLDAAAYSAVDRLRDGRAVLIRALKPADQVDLDLAVARVSDVSLYRRFFAIRRSFSERERKAFVTVDFVDHVALIALADENGREAIVGGGRYVVVQPGRAEVAFIVIDAYQGQGLGSALLRHLTGLARAAGLREFIAEVLPENQPMLEVFQHSGLPISTSREPGVVHVSLRLE